MNTVNLQSSMNNLTQVDRVQADSHRMPVTNQMQNIASAKIETDHRMQAPVQLEQSDPKNVNPDERKRVFIINKRKKQAKKHPEQRRPAGDGGRFVDMTA
jgi:hypothetical protein